MLKSRHPLQPLRKVYFSAAGPYLPGHLNILASSHSPGDLLTADFPPGSLSAVRADNIFNLLPLSDCCFFLYLCRSWLGADGLLVLRGFGPIGNNIPLLLLQMLYAAGFLAINGTDRESAGDDVLMARSYSPEMPEYIHVGRIKNFLKRLSAGGKDEHCRGVDHFTLFYDRLRSLSP